MPRLARRLAALSVLLAATPALALPAAASAKGKDQAVAHARRHKPKRPGPPTAVPAFVLQAVRVDGSTKPALVAAAVRPFIGRRIDAAGLQQVTDAVARAYDRDGSLALYTVSAPKQDFADGVLHLNVLEGWAEDVVIQGGKGRDIPLVKAYAARLTSERPLTRRTLERYTSLIRDVPGLNPDVQLVAGGKSGTVRVVVNVRPRPVQLAVSVNNRGTALLGRTQVQADLYLNNLLGRGDQTRLSAALPTDISRFQLYSVVHSEPVGRSGLTASVYGSYLTTRPKGTDVAGTARAVGVQAYYPALRGYQRNLYLTAGLDGLNADNALFGTRFSADHSRAARLGLVFTDRTARREATLAATTSFGLPVLGAKATDPATTDLGFAKLNLRLIYLHAVGNDWVVRLNGAAQVSGDRLPGSEQMTLGGEEFGRAYEAAFVSGDRGYAGSAELAYRPPAAARIAEGAEAYLFIDGGEVWYLGRAGSPTRAYRLASTGAGVRVPVRSKALLQLEATRGLSNPYPGVDRERWRGVFAVRSVF